MYKAMPKLAIFIWPVHVLTHFLRTTVNPFQIFKNIHDNFAFVCLAAFIYFSEIKKRIMK